MLFQDPDIPIQTKLSYIIESLSSEDDSSLYQVITEYEFCMSSILFDILKMLILSPDVSGEYKYLIISSLYSMREEINNDKELELLISTYIPQSSVIEFNIMKWLFSFGDPNTHFNRLLKYLSNTDLKDTIKFSQLLSIKYEYKEQVLNGVKFLLKHTCDNRCKILCSQYILSCDESKDFEYIFKILFDIVDDEKETENIRADSADVIHHYSSGEIQERALQILSEIGGNTNDIYKNSQNIHRVDISEGIEILKDIKSSLSFTDIAKIITSNDSKISSSIGRIAVDQAKYGNMKASEILVKLYQFIIDHKNKDSLMERLFEELRDMSDTCSSGHGLRLFNVLTGFGADVKISFSDQLISSFEGRLNARMRNDPNRENIVSDMVDMGVHFSKFFCSNYHKIIEELYSEYNQYVNDEIFDQAIQKVLEKYSSVKNMEDMEFNPVKKYKE